MSPMLDVARKALEKRAPPDLLELDKAGIRTADLSGVLIARTPNNHVGFGGHGPHFCLGAHLARRELAVTFRRLFEICPDLEITGEPDRLRSSFVNGLKRLPARLTGQR